MALLAAAFRSAGSDEAHLVHRKPSPVQQFFWWTCPRPVHRWKV